MSVHTSKHQIIELEGQPVFALLPYNDYIAMLEQNDEGITIPHEVVGLSLKYSFVRAWREYLGLTQQEMASRMKISQPAYSKLEDKNATPRFATLKRIADAMGLDVRQLDI